MTYLEIQINKKFLNFKEIVDDYLDGNFLYEYNILTNYKNSKYKLCYDCEHGSIEFVNNNKKSNKKIIIIHEIYIKTQYRNKGLCKNFIKYLIDKSDYKTCIIIQSVLSKILYDFLLRFEYQDQKFIVKKEGFIWYK